MPLLSLPWSGTGHLPELLLFPAAFTTSERSLPLPCLLFRWSRRSRNISGTVEMQYVGLAAVTDLRNEIYEKLVRQPIGFFQQHPTGRLMSTVINDVERVRVTSFRIRSLPSSATSSRLFF